MLLEFLQPKFDRLKAENHPNYQRVIRDAQVDDTTGERYGSRGRFSALAYRMSGNPAHAQRAYRTVLSPRTDWAAVPVIESNERREHAAESLLTLAWIMDALEPQEIAGFRGWLERTVVDTLADAQRLNDSDRVVGEYMFIRLFDKVFGTTYAQHPNAIAMRAALRKFCTVFGKGGQWPEASDYNTGTLFLLFQGAEMIGIAEFPEVAAFRAEFIKLLPHMFTPGLRDAFEFGDDQTPHNPTWHALEGLLAYLSHHSPAMRQFAKDLKVAWKRVDTEPLYTRFFVWDDPYGAVAPWDTGDTFAVAEGVGQVYSRTSWKPDAAAMMAQFPPFSLGTLDHAYMQFGDFRYWADLKWRRDRPIAYSGAMLLSNTTILAGLACPTEVGVLTGATRVPGKLTYQSGSNAGPNAANGRYLPPMTLRNELSRSIYSFEDCQVQLVIERIHITDVGDLGRFAETTLKAKAAASVPIESIWQSQKIKPVVTGTAAAPVIQCDDRIQPLYPATCTVVDQALPMPLGTIATTERGFYTGVVPLEAQQWQILNTLFGNATATVERLGDVQRVRVKVAGLRDKVIYSSAKVSPKLTTTIVSKLNKSDPTKIVGILAARTVTIDPKWAEPNADVYVELANGLHVMGVGTDPTGPTCETQLAAALADVARLLLDAGRLQGEMTVLADLNRTLTTENTAQRVRAETAEGVVQDVRNVVGPDATEKITTWP